MVDPPYQQVIPGLGIRSDAAALGNQLLMSREGFVTSPKLQHQIDAATASGLPIALVGWSSRVCGAFVFEESLRPAVRELLDWCRSHNLPVTVLTGDHVQRGQRLAAELHVPVKAGLLPADKADFIRRREATLPKSAKVALSLRDRKAERRKTSDGVDTPSFSESSANLSRSDRATRAGRVAMLGDGVNDAAALTAAHIGISLGAGTDVSRDAAAICLLNNDLAALPWAIELSQHTVVTIRRNLIWSFTYNAAGVLIAAFGFLNPAIAALLMVVSSLVVVRSARSVVQTGRDDFKTLGAGGSPTFIESIRASEPLVLQ